MSSTLAALTTTKSNNLLPEIDKQQGIIIGLTVGLISLAVIIIVTCICCCCRKTERSCFKRAMRRQENKYNAKRETMTVAQEQRREEMNKRHQDIRDKYNIPAPGTVSGSLDGQTKYGVENDQVSFSMR